MFTPLQSFAAEDYLAYVWDSSNNKLVNALAYQINVNNDTKTVKGYIPQGYANFNNNNVRDNVYFGLPVRFHGNGLIVTKIYVPGQIPTNETNESLNIEYPEADASISESYAFKGWSISSGNTKIITKTIGLNDACGVDLYAVWERTYQSATEREDVYAPCGGTLRCVASSSSGDGGWCSDTMQCDRCGETGYWGHSGNVECYWARTHASRKVGTRPKMITEIIQH